MTSALAKPYRIAVIGAGEIGRQMMRRIFESPSCELAAVADQSPELLRETLLIYPSIEIADDVLNFLRSTDVDAVVVTTTPSTHTVFAGEALNAGKHVLVCPPISKELRAANALAEFSQAKGHVLMVANESMFHPEVSYVRQMIDDNEMGSILYIDSETSLVHDQPEDGVLWNVAPNALAPILYWVDELPMAVEAVGRSYTAESRNDATFLTLHFASGIILQERLSWLAPVESRRTTITGAKAMAVIDQSNNADRLRIYRRQIQNTEGKTVLFGNIDRHANDVEIPHVSDVDVIEAELDHFIHCIRYGQKPLSSARTGIWAVSIIEAAERALYSGRRERIDYPPVKTPALTNRGRRFSEASRSV